MRDIMLKALSDHAKGSINLHRANIEVYFTNPSGIGEHSDIMEAVQGELDKIAIHADRLSILNSFAGDTNE